MLGVPKTFDQRSAPARQAVADLMFSLRLWIAMGVHSRWYLPDLGACDVMAFNSQPTTPGATQGSLVATRLNTPPFVQGANPR